MVVSANRLELLQIADAVAREKSIDREIVIAAMADAIQKAARSRYGQETNIRVDINTKTGEMRLQRLLEVVEDVEDPNTQIYLELARDKNPDAEPGDFIAEQLPPMEFGRIAAQSVATPTAVTAPAMPAFHWRMTDQQVADVSTYIRNSWGNAAPAVTVDQVRKVREELGER